MFWVVGICAVLLALSSTAYGSSKKWRAHNNTDKTVKVFWTAAGCAGQKAHCVEMRLIPYVCKAKILQPGESDYYKFKDGTSRREKKACRMDGEKTVRKRKETHHRKKNGIRLDDEGAVEWYYD